MDRARKYSLIVMNVRRLTLNRATRAEIGLWCLAACLVLQLRLIGIPVDYVHILLLLCVAGTLAAGALESLAPIAPPIIAAVRPHVGLRWPVAGALGGLVCAAIGSYLVARDPWNAQWWWLAGMAVSIGSLAIPHARALRKPHFRLPAAGWWSITVSVLLFTIAFIVRIVNITGSPPFVLGDEGQCGLYGRLFNAGHTPLLSISWFGLPMMSYAISGVGLRLFGDSLDGLRLINAVIGSAGVVLVYLLGKQLFGRLPGLLAGIVLAFAFLHVEMSRDGIHYIQGPTCITLAMYLCALWLTRGGLTPALLSGMTLALSLQLYWSARIAAPLLVSVLVVILVLDRGLLLSRWREIAWCGVGAAVAGLPVAGLFRSQPGSFDGHQVAVSVLGNDPGARAQIAGEYGTLDLPVVLWHQIGRMLPTFNVTPDATSIFGPWGGSMLDVVTAALLPAAVVLAVLRIRHWQYSVPLIWIGAVVLGGVLTLDPPNWPRTTALLPALALLFGVFLAEIWRVGRGFIRSRWIALSVMIGLLGWMALANLDLVYRSFPDATVKTSMTATNMGKFLQHAPDAAHGVLLSDGSIYITYEAIQFLAPNASGCTLMPGKALNSCPLFKTSHLFIVLPGRISDLPVLIHLHPGGKIVTVGGSDAAGNQIIAYELPAKIGSFE
jgi:4-amino-4-deoxy-L-arabinose transferase-like glycosyltransferase